MQRISLVLSITTFIIIVLFFEIIFYIFAIIFLGFVICGIINIFYDFILKNTDKIINRINK